MKYFVLFFLILISCSKDENYYLVKEVVITFDDAPNFPENTGKILDVLKNHHVKATFFCIGQFLKMYPDLANRIAAEQFIGNHTYTHINVKNSNLNDIFKQEILQTQDIIDSLQPLNKHYFRPPYGKLSANQSLTLGIKGFDIVMWDLSAEEWDNSVSAQNVVDYFRTNLYTKIKIQVPIILFHINKSTVEALDILLTEFEERNIKVITLDDFKVR